jgi:6-phosphogluconolactonase
MTPEVLTADQAALAERIAADFEAEARRVQAQGRSFRIALSGGSIGSAFFPRLARLPIDWNATEFFWVDERAVSPADPESNYGMARLLWLERAGVPDNRVHRMMFEGADPRAAVAAYTAVLTGIAGRPPQLDYVMLGVGPDGHVASLFPGHPALAETTRPVVAIDDSPKPPPRRMTLTLPVLTSAARVVIATFGLAKVAIMREALTQTTSSLPVSQVIHKSLRPLVLMESTSGVFT